MKELRVKNLCGFSFTLLLILLISNFQSVFAQQLAFPSAKGAGAYASGGRGGQVIHVTTLDWDAPGGLKEAIQTPGPRTIVFDVSGEIDATQEGAFAVIINGSNYDNLTIAGQTAPEGGITVKTSYLMFQDVDNVIVRYVRFRNEGIVIEVGTSQYLPDSFKYLGGTDIIFDHCTFSHGMDQSATWGNTSGVMGNVTVQNCFFQDSKTGSILGVDEVEGDFTFINNVYSGISHRFPNPKGNGQYDIINNVVYNWRTRLIRITHEGTYNVMNNYYKPSVGGLRSNAWYGDGVISANAMQKLQAKTNKNPLIYTSGNIVTGQRETPQTDDSDMWVYFTASDAPYTPNTPVGSQFFTSTQFPLVGEIFTIETASDAYNNIVVEGDLGAYKTLNADGSTNIYRDTKDAGDLNMIINDTYNGSFFDDISSIPHPTLPSNTRPSGYDTDNDGMPDAWETANGLNPNVADNNGNDLDVGYTNLEMFLNQIDNTGPVPAVDVTGVDVTPETAEIFISDAIALSVNVMPSNATDQSGIWESSDETIATVDANGVVTPVAVGEVTITFISNDNPDLFDSSIITVFPEAFEANAGPDQTICQGESVVLSASGGTTYLWNNGETTASIEVSPTVTTIYTVTVFDDLGNSDDDSVTVTVNELPIADAGNDQTICEGDTIELTASGGTEYIWSTGETTASIQVTPSSDTLYTVEVISSGCTSTDNVTVFVNPSPNLTISNNITIVEGDSIQLSVTGASNYEWSTGETTNIITVSPIETTTYTVTGTTGVCSSQAQVTVTVEELLVVSAGQDENVCEDDTYEVVLTASPGDSYLWSTGETTQSIVVSPLSTTTYSVTVASGIQEDTDDVTVFVNPNPDVVILNGESVDIMSGDFVTLSASGANTYEWNNGATQPNIAVSPSQTTTYEVRGYIGNCYDEKQVTVNVIPEVEADAGDDQDICLGDVVTLTATGGDEYVWSTGETTQSIQVSPTETTEYTVTVFNALDFDEDTVTVFVDNNCNDGGVVDNPVDGPALDFDFSVYPNPATEYVDIKLSGSDQLTGFYLYDLTGKLIFQKRVENENLSVSSTTRIDVSSLRPGIYLVKIADVQRELYRRLIIR